MRVITWIFLLVLTAFSVKAEAQIAIQQVVGNLAQPTDIANARDGSNRLFIVLQGGSILIYNGQLLATPFLNISSLISTGGERGLLSLAFHPSYKTNGYFFICYTALNGTVTIDRYKVSTNANVANASSRQNVLTIPHSANTNHNGGKIAFSPKNGYLYISVGDGGGGGDPNNYAQNLNTLLGKILRIDVNTLPYRIPSTNPFINTTGARKEIWARGLRNPWKIGFDRSNGNLYVSDVGQDLYEEVNFQTASAGGGVNYGWRKMEGKHCFNPATNCNTGSLKLPIAEYAQSTGVCSVTGGYVYRGTAIPAIAGSYIHSDFCDGKIRSLKKVNGVWTSSVLLSSGKRISTFGENEQGEIYFAHYSGTTSVIYKIVRQ